MEKRIISKVDIAKRHICESVRLFFEKRDAIVIHVIISAAHQILFDLSHRAGVKSALKNTHALKQKEFQEFLASINYPYNFFKHADRDHDKNIDIGPLERLTEDFIMDAIIMLQQIDGRIPTEAKVYWLWFVSNNHVEFDDLPKNSAIAKMQELELGNMSFPEILAFLEFAEMSVKVDPYMGEE